MRNAGDQSALRLRGASAVDAEMAAAAPVPAKRRKPARGLAGGGVGAGATGRVRLLICPALFGGHSVKMTADSGADHRGMHRNRAFRHENSAGSHVRLHGPNIAVL